MAYEQFIKKYDDIIKINCYAIKDDKDRNECLQLNEFMKNKKMEIDNSIIAGVNDLRDVVNQLDTIDFFKNTLKNKMESKCGALLMENTKNITVSVNGFEIDFLGAYILIISNHAKTNFKHAPLLKKYNDILNYKYDSYYKSDNIISINCHDIKHLQ